MPAVIHHQMPNIYSTDAGTSIKPTKSGDNVLGSDADKSVISHTSHKNMNDSILSLAEIVHHYFVKVLWEERPMPASSKEETLTVTVPQTPTVLMAEREEETAAYISSHQFKPRPIPDLSYKEEDNDNPSISTWHGIQKDCSCVTSFHCQ